MAKTTTATKPKTAKTAATPKPKTAKKPDMEKLQSLADEIGRYRGRNQTNLVHRLETEEGMKATTRENGFTYIKLAGIDARAQGGMDAALINWGNAARRALVKGAT